MDPTTKKGTAAAGIAVGIAAVIGGALMLSQTSPSLTQPTQPAPQKIFSPSPTPKSSAQPSPMLQMVAPKVSPTPTKPLAAKTAISVKTADVPPCDGRPSITGNVLRASTTRWQVILLDPPTIIPCTMGPLKTTMPQYGLDASTIEVTITFTRRG